MIFAELAYPEHYGDVHEQLLAFVCSRFALVEAGMQGDSWIWISAGDEKVALDTFLSKKHQVRARGPGPHVDAVIGALKERYAVVVYDQPIPEADDAE